MIQHSVHISNKDTYSHKLHKNISNLGRSKKRTLVSMLFMICSTASIVYNIPNLLFASSLQIFCWEIDNNEKVR